MEVASCPRAVEVRLEVGLSELVDLEHAFAGDGGEVPVLGALEHHPQFSRAEFERHGAEVADEARDGEVRLDEVLRVDVCLAFVGYGGCPGVGVGIDRLVVVNPVEVTVVIGGELDEGPGVDLDTGPQVRGRRVELVINRVPVRDGVKCDRGVPHQHLAFIQSPFGVRGGAAIDGFYCAAAAEQVLKSPPTLDRVVDIGDQRGPPGARSDALGHVDAEEVRQHAGPRAGGPCRLRADDVGGYSGGEVTCHSPPQSVSSVVVREWVACGGCAPQQLLRGQTCSRHRGQALSKQGREVVVVDLWCERDEEVPPFEEGRSAGDGYGSRELSLVGGSGLLELARTCGPTIVIGDLHRCPPDLDVTDGVEGGKEAVLRPERHVGLLGDLGTQVGFERPDQLCPLGEVAAPLGVFGE
ncbi:hypothetical protein NOZE110980_19090 [Nocardioides zeicaulis]